MSCLRNRALFYFWFGPQILVWRARVWVNQKRLALSRAKLWRYLKAERRDRIINPHRYKL